ncbi:MAG: hypothetical protein AB2L18_07380 [Anaerolineaceae bacterium]
MKNNKPNFSDFPATMTLLNASHPTGEDLLFPTGKKTVVIYSSFIEKKLVF